MDKDVLLRNYKKTLILSLATIGVIVISLVTLSLSWFNSKKEIDTLTWIKTPIVLTLGSGEDKDIKFMDMGNIDVKDGNKKSYVFCVHGKPVDYYFLQLAYTTNIEFNYTVYRAKLVNSDYSGDKVESKYIDENGLEQASYFTKMPNEDNTAILDPVIEAKSLGSLDPKIISSHQHHDFTYSNYNNVQKNAEPLYWLASEDGLDVLYPVSIYESGTEFCDYFILEVSWNNLENSKETDMVYLTVSF